MKGKVKGLPLKKVTAVAPPAEKEVPRASTIGPWTEQNAAGVVWWMRRTWAAGTVASGWAADAQIKGKRVVWRVAGGQWRRADSLREAMLSADYLLITSERWRGWALSVGIPDTEPAER